SPPASPCRHRRRCAQPGTVRSQAWSPSPRSWRPIQSGVSYRVLQRNGHCYFFAIVWVNVPGVGLPSRVLPLNEMIAAGPPLNRPVFELLRMPLLLKRTVPPWAFRPKVFDWVIEFSMLMIDEAAEVEKPSPP